MSDSKGRGYIHALTGIRGLAAWWVVFYHFREQMASQLPLEVIQFFSLGYLAVDLFFVLSGFVIYYNYQHMFDRLDRQRLWSFFAARIARIYPLHLFITLMYLLNPLALMFASTARAVSIKTRSPVAPAWATSPATGTTSWHNRRTRGSSL